MAPCTCRVFPSTLIPFANSNKLKIFIVVDSIRRQLFKLLPIQFVSKVVDAVTITSTFVDTFTHQITNIKSKS